MRFFKFYKNRNKGISSVVGGLFFLVLMTTGFSVYYVALDNQSRMIETQQVIADAEIKKIQEKYVISVATDPSDNNRLQIFVKNQGNHPIEITNIWIVNKTDTSEPATKYELNYVDSFVPAGWGGQILENTALYMVPDVYDIKTVSTLGTIRTAELDVVSGINNLRAELYMIPPDVKLGENATVVMYVTNTGSTLVTDVTPDNDPPISDNPTWISNSQLVSPSSIDLEPSQSGIFVWQTELSMSGTVNSKLMFADSVSGTESATGNTVQSNTDSDKITLRENEEGEGQTIVLTDDLLTRPRIFMVIPSPFGDDGQQGLWGLNVVNPTSQTMDVSKVTITALPSRPQQQDQIFNSNSCGALEVPPTPSGWSCSADNQITWKGTLTIPQYSVFPFLAKVQAGSLAGSADNLESILVQGNVFTTLGQFGKGGYGTSMKNTGSAVVNVYLTDLPGSTSDANLITNMTGIPTNSVVTFNATIADFDTGSTKKIDSGSRLIINIPKGWIVDTGSIDTFGDFTWTYQSFSDTSSQLVGTLSADLTGFGGVARTIQFDATAPQVSNTKLYVMYILADGTVTNDDFSIGPLAEVILQVVP